MKKKSLYIWLFLALLALSWLACVIVTGTRINEAMVAARYTNDNGICRVEVYHDKPFDLFVRGPQGEFTTPSQFNWITLKYEMVILTAVKYKPGETENWRRQILGGEYLVSAAEENMVTRVDQ